MGEQKKKEKDSEPKEAPQPKADGYAIYDYDASSISWIFLSYLDDAKRNAERQFARLHAKSGERVPNLRLVKLSEVADSEAFWKDPDKFRHDDEIPPVDRAL